MHDQPVTSCTTSGSITIWRSIFFPGEVPRPSVRKASMNTPDSSQDTEFGHLRSEFFVASGEASQFGDAREAPGLTIACGEIEPILLRDGFNPNTGFCPIRLGLDLQCPSAPNYPTV